MSKSNMEILAQMVKGNKDIGVSINQVTNVQKVKAGALVTVGVDATFGNKLMISVAGMGGESYHSLLFIANKREYDEIMNEVVPVPEPLDPTATTASLTKENFWDDIFAKFPKECDVFCKWVDEYKARVGWNGLFRSISIPGSSHHAPPKFHDMPYFVQLGMWIEFVTEQGGCSYEVDLFEMDLREEITGYFENVIRLNLEGESND